MDIALKDLTTKEAIAEIFREHLKMQRVSLGQVAKKMPNTDESTLRKYVNRPNEQNPTLEKLEEMSDALGFSPLEFVSKIKTRTDAHALFHVDYVDEGQNLHLSTKPNEYFVINLPGIFKPPPRPDGKLQNIGLKCCGEGVSTLRAPANWLMSMVYLEKDQPVFPGEMVIKLVEDEDGIRGVPPDDFIGPGVFDPNIERTGDNYRALGILAPWGYTIHSD